MGIVGPANLLCDRLRRQTVSGGNLLLDVNVDADATAEMSVVLVGQTATLSVVGFVLLS